MAGGADLLLAAGAESSRRVGHNCDEWRNERKRRPGPGFSSSAGSMSGMKGLDILLEAFALATRERAPPEAGDPFSRRTGLARWEIAPARLGAPARNRKLG